MNMKKIVMVSVLILSLLLCLCACGEGKEAPTTDPVNTSEPTDAPTDAPTEEVREPERLPSYTVTVVDEEGNPISGAIVQMCLEACVPGVTNEDGVAEFFLAEEDYKVSFVKLPEGYEIAGEETEFYFAEGENTMIITLKAVEEEAIPTYTVLVVDEDNNPVSGAIVQMCLEACVPGVTNEEGIAEFYLAEGDYKVSFVMVPQGYEIAGEETEFYFAEGESTMTITLKAVA